MKNDRFNEIVKETLGTAEEVLCQKSAEYSRGGDKLHNFRRGGEILNCSPEKALMGMKLKHDISVMDIVNDLDDGSLASKELIDEKIGDSINYLLLLKACLYDRFILR